MRDHLKAFLEHLRLNENASAHTVRAYESDLSQYLAFLATHVGRRVSELTPGDLDHLGVRAFIGDLNKRGNAKALKAWQQGRTGYPIVDAGMRELWTTGWMHNRVRMVVASFLVKDLRIDWQSGERYFMERLVDGDLAANNGNAANAASRAR